MSSASYLTKSRHGSIYYARISIPKSLRSHFRGQREFRISLRTPCKDTAKRRALRVWLACQNTYDDLRNGKTVNLTPPYFGSLDFDNWSKREQSKEATAAKNTFESPADASPLLQTVPTEPLALDGLTLTYSRAVYRGQTIEVDFPCPTAEQEAVERFMDNVDRRLGFSEIHAVAQPAVKESRKFSAAADDYIEQYRRNREYDKTLRSSTFDKESRAVSFWKYYFGDCHLDEINKETCRRAELDCRNYPKNVDAKIAATMCRSPHDRPLTGVQATKTKLHVLKKILDHSKQHGWIDQNPADVIDTRQRRDKVVEKHPFTIAELQKIFPGTSYGDKFTTKSAKRDPAYDAPKFWTPLIALLSGARLGEIMQLELDDIKEENGIWYFDITPESTSKTVTKELKTKGSKRRVPIHSALIHIGLLDYVDERRGCSLKPGGFFDQHTVSSHAKGKVITEWFKGGPNGRDRHGKPRMRSGYLDRCGVLCRPDQRADGSSVSFHSFRHTFADAARNSTFATGEAIRDEDSRWILGHSSSLMTTKYGRGKDLSFLQSVVEAVQFPEVDLKSISWQRYKEMLGMEASSAA